MVSRCFILWLLFACMVSALQADRVSNRLELYYGMAEGNYLIGDLSGADRGIEQMLRTDPDYVPALVLQARVRLDQKRPEAALEALERAIAVYRKKSGQEALERSTALRLMRARLLAQCGQAEAAISDLQTLTGQQPENFEALITLASIYASVERWTSLEALIPGIAARPELRDVAFYLEGRAALAQDRVGTARAKFEAALEALPEDADSLRRSLYFYRGLCLQRLGRESEAERSLLNAIDAGFRPETSAEAIIASQTLLRSDRAADAIPLLEAITLNRMAATAEVWAMLGRAHLASDTPALALSAFNEALQIDPTVPTNRALRGSLLRKIGDLEGALADYNRAQEAEPENAAIAYARGLVHLQLGQIAEAHTAMAQAAEGLPSQAGVQLLNALLAYVLGANEATTDALRRYQQNLSELSSPTARYLDYLLNGVAPAAQHRGAIDHYYRGQHSLKEAIDAAGQAETPEQARRQICSAAFWMAQFERQQGNAQQTATLLNIALDAGNPDLTEYQLAKWQLREGQP